jgi:glycerate kinase
VKIVAATNALKGSLSAVEAAAAVARGARRVSAELEVIELPIADGGDGTAEVLARAHSGVFNEFTGLDALGRARHGRFALLPDGSAVLDVATLSGLAALASDERRALQATSYGTGQLLRAALEAGATRVVIGAGGSASTDGGAGILVALGARLLDAENEPLQRGGAALERLARIDLTELLPAARSVPIQIACDVDNPLLGPSGSARVFAPQKGASDAEVTRLESALLRYAEVLLDQLQCDVSQLARGGAAGGVAAGLHAVLGAQLVSGIELVLDSVGFDRAAAGSSLCVTTEGKVDRQSLRDKAPWGVARRARACGAAVTLLCGAIEHELWGSDFPLFDGMFSICARPMLLQQAMAGAAPLLSDAAEQVVRLFCAARRACAPSLASDAEPSLSRPHAQPSSQRAPRPKE